MPVYLWLMGDDSRRKTGMTFDAQPGRKPGNCPMSDERYRERQQRLKDKVDARVAAAQDERGIVMVFTGNGKRQKPPPPLAPRPAQSAGRKKVGVIQFIKGDLA